MLQICTDSNEIELSFSEAMALAKQVRYQMVAWPSKIQENQIRIYTLLNIPARPIAGTNWRYHPHITTHCAA